MPPSPRNSGSSRSSRGNNDDPRRVSRTLLRKWSLPDLDAADDKEDRGTVLVVGGSVSLAGAVVLAGTAVLRAGAGKLQIATCRSVAPMVGVAVPEALAIGLDETATGLIDPAAASVTARYADEADVTLIGPGMSTDSETRRFVSEVVGKLRHSKLVLDAGALAALHSDRGALNHLEGNAVITPHTGEMASLMNIPRETVSRNQQSWAVRAASELNAVVALKGAETFISSPGGDVYRYSGGGVGLGTSGSGDTLGGIIAGLMARGASPLQAAVWGVYVHGSAGRVLAKKIGRVGFLARELLDEVPAILRAV